MCSLSGPLFRRTIDMTDPGGTADDVSPAPVTIWWVALSGLRP